MEFPRQSLKHSNDTQIERKRALDRKAQKAARQRTKNTIADLEQELASYRSSDANAMIADLIKTISELRSENARYQGIFEKMREFLGATAGTAQRESFSPTTQIPTKENKTDNLPIASYYHGSNPQLDVVVTQDPAQVISTTSP